MTKNKTALALQARIRNPATRHNAIHQFRRGFEERDFFAAYRLLFPYKTSLQDFHGAAFPRRAEQIINNRTPKQSVLAFREILWAIARSLHFVDELRHFVRLRERYEIFVLQHDFENAARCLDEVESHFGKSIWLYQSRLACAYISSVESEPLDTAHKIIEEVKGNSFLHAIIYYARRRIEGATLRDKLRAEVSQQIDSATYEAYFLAKIFDVTDSAETAVSSLLFVDSQASLIDHYNSLILVLQAALSDKMLGASMGSWIAPSLQQLYKGTNDRRLVGVLAGLGHFVKSFEDDGRRAAAIEAYTAGDYEKCIQLSRGLLLSDPLDSALRLLMIKAEVASKTQTDRINGVCGDLHENLFNVLSANDQFFRSVHALIQMADRFLDHSWMLYFRVVVWYEIGAEEAKRTRSWMRDIYVRDSFVTPLMALAMDPSHADKIINHLEGLNSYPLTVELVRATLACPAADPQTLTRRELRYQARELLASENYRSAAAYFLQAGKHETGAANRLRVLGGASLALMLDGQYQQAIDTLIAALLECPNAPTLLPFKEVVNRLPDADRWPNTISLSLLFSMAGQLEQDDDLSKLRLSFERFCDQNAISTPTQLADRISEFGSAHVIAYLDSVWQPEVMRQTLLYGSPTQIEEARIEACQVLARIDPERARTHRAELASRIKQQEIAKATALVEQSKVYVDIDAIKRSLKARLKSSYAQYKNSLTQYEKPNNDLLKTFQTVFEGFESASLSTIFSQVYLVDDKESPTQADIHFSAIFGEITKEFLTGDHSLNAYLSTRVRHGKLVDALRKSVMDEHLVTARMENGDYVENVHWSNEVTSLADGHTVIDALARFSRRFDETLFFARDRRIQIQTYYDLKPIDDNDEGLFRYHFSKLERRLMQSYDVDFKDFDELIGKCVDSLWEKTDLNLVAVRKYVSGILRDELIEHFDTLTSEIMERCGATIPSPLANAIARSRTATQQAIENVSGWFHRSEVYDRQDFDVEFPSQIAANMVNRTLSIPQPWSGPECIVEFSDSKLPGRALDSLVDIFYVILENGAKYAESEGIPLNIRIVLRYQLGEFRCEAISQGNPPSLERLEMLRDLRTSLQSQESRRLAQSEGRSGFRKILVALSNSIYRAPSLDFEHERTGQFKVSFGFKIADQA